MIFEIGPLLERFQFRQVFLGPNEPQLFGASMGIKNKRSALWNCEFPTSGYFCRSFIRGWRRKERIKHWLLVGRRRALIQNIQITELPAAEDEVDARICPKDLVLAYSIWFPTWSTFTIVLGDNGVP